MIRRHLKLWTTVVLVTVGSFGAMAFAQDGHGDDAHVADAHEDDGHGPASNNPIESGTISNAVATVITFGLVVLILGKFVWPHVLKALKDREDFIRDSLESAKRDRQEAEKRLQEYQEQIKNARQEATAIVEEGRRDSEVLRRKVQDEAKQEADAIIVRAKREIGIARDTAVKDLYSLSGELATNLAGKILQKELDTATHERLIQESIEQIAKLETRN